jgi:putative peptide zinc metalloprotease protein
MRLSPAAHFIVTRAEAGASCASIARELSERCGEDVTTERIESTYADLRQRIDAGRTRRDAAFLVRLPVVRAEMVGILAAPFAVLFSPPAIAALAVTGLLGFVAAVRYAHPLHATAASFLEAYGLFLLSLVAHELGHAAAAVRYGARVTDIGLTLYAIFPAFYTDVTDAWRLRRGRRVMLDLGGVLLQSVVGTLYVAIFALSAQPAFALAALSILASCIFSLNPAFKNDGYWVLADAFDVPDLAKRAGAVLRRRFDGRHRALTFSYLAITVATWSWIAWNIVGGVRRLAAAIASGHVNLATLPPAAFVQMAVLFALVVVLVHRTLLRLRRRAVAPEASQ